MIGGIFGLTQELGIQINDWWYIWSYPGIRNTNQIGGIFGLTQELGIQINDWWYIWSYPIIRNTNQ